MQIPLLALLVALPCLQAPQDPGATPNRPYKLNQLIDEEPQLADLAGKSHALFTEYKDKALVLVFWSYKDPVSRHYAKPLAALQAAHADKAAIVLVDSNYDELTSGSGDPLAKLAKVVETEKITLPLLVDHDNALADAFNATANGQCFLIDANHFLRYHGGIDDDPDGSRTEKGLPPRTWLADALETVVAAGVPKDPWTRPSGRPIKRTPKATEAGAGGTPRKPAPKKP